jgi:4-hydroxy-tetrahydrodipicolinate synthase
MTVRVKDWLKGSLPAIVTPMEENGDLDFRAFDSLIDWHVEKGSSGLVVAGTTGESPTLNSEEHCEVIARCVERVNQRIPVIAGTGSNSTEEALFFTREAKRLGVDACLLVTPYYNNPSQEGLYRHFSMIEEAVDIPQILYNVPGRTVCDMSNETVLRLAELPNIIGIKDATGDLLRGQTLLASCSNDFVVLSGDDETSRELMLLGARGSISVTANVVPDRMSEMCESMLTENFDRAAELDKSISALHKELFVEANPVPVKWALGRMEKIKFGIRLPLIPLSEKYHVQLEKALRDSGVSLED